MFLSNRLAVPVLLLSLQQCISPQLTHTNESRAVKVTEQFIYCTYWMYANRRRYARCCVRVKRTLWKKKTTNLKEPMPTAAEISLCSIHLQPSLVCRYKLGLHETQTKRRRCHTSGKKLQCYNCSGRVRNHGEWTTKSGSPASARQRPTLLRQGCCVALAVL